MKTQDLLSKINDNKVITEREINLLKRRLNNGEYVDLSNIIDNEIKLTSEQTKKGYNFLKNCWKTKKGKERVNNPFGYREENILETFTHFEFSGFYDCSRYGMKEYYIPLYLVCGKEGCFEFYYDFEGVNIVG